MSSTTNLNMQIVENDDLASPEPFNSNFQILDKLGLDYVIEEYDKTISQGGWHVRKWKSGFVEMDGMFAYNSKSSSESVIGYIYVPFPETLEQLYATTASAGVHNHGNSWIMYVGDDKTRLDIWIHDDSRFNEKYWVMAHVAGKVKS